MLDLDMHEEGHCTNERKQREKQTISRLYGSSLGDDLIFCKIIIL